MTEAQWLDLQAALVWTFGPLIFWGLVVGFALAWFAAAWALWLGLLRWMSQLGR